MLATGQWQDVQVSWAPWQAPKKPYHTPRQCSHLQVLPELYFPARSTAVPLTGLLSSHGWIARKSACWMLPWGGSLSFFLLKPKYKRKNIKQKLQITVAYSSSFLQTWAQTPEYPGSWFLYWVRTNNLLLEIIFQLVCSSSHSGKPAHW